MNAAQLQDRLPALLGDALLSQSERLGEVTCEIAAPRIVEACGKLRDADAMRFETLTDLCGVDYANWGASDETQGGTGSPGGPAAGGGAWRGRRFAVVYHLLSLRYNRRLRLRAALDDDAPALDSVVEVWPVADWYEREAFDLFGIVFNGHPDLRRLLTDYGFIGHPFRKDFPLSGEVEMRYDEEQGRVIYQPVTIEPRTLVPRTISRPAGDPGNNAAENLGDNTTDNTVDNPAENPAENPAAQD